MTRTWGPSCQSPVRRPVGGPAGPTPCAACLPSTELVRSHTDLDADDVAWLQLLQADWQIIADLSFADLVLWLPDREGKGFWAAGQMRPTTGPTAYVDDVIGTFVPVGRRPLIDAAYAEGRLVREGDPEWRDDVPVRVETIPVRRAGRVIAVVARNTNLLGVRTPSRLELSYLQTAADLTQMIAHGYFPAAGQRSDHADTPRVGDGFLRVDATGRVVYASPNALSVFRRLGLSGDLAGLSLADDDPRAGAAATPARRGDPERGARRPGAPRHRDRHRRGLADRALHPAAPAGRPHRRAGAGARRHRPAAARPRAGHQGRHDPRDPPPGEEQPADRRRAAAPAGAPDGQRVGAARARGGRTPGRVDRDRPRDPQPGGRGAGRLRRDHRPARPDGHRGERGRQPGAGPACGHLRRAAVGVGDRAGDGADRAAAERRRARLRPRTPPS